LHLSRGEGSSAIITTVLLVLVTIVAFMRWKVAPIARRQRA
jgi:flagellin-like protein